MTTGKDGAYGAAEEAAAEWLVRLGDRGATPDMTDAFQAWLGAAPENAPAFERVSRVWTGLGEAGPRWRGRGRTRVVASACAALVAAICIGVMLRDPTYSTGRGERETVTLEDGSRLTLNTDSRVSIHYARDERHVVLGQGEVFFDVARNPDRPFIVEAGDDRVRVLGTSFLVRRDSDRLQVALVSGSVMVAQDGGLTTAPIMLTPGERVRTSTDGDAVIDKPLMNRLLAWRRGELVLDETPVGEAVAEMNRYSDSQIVIDDPAVKRAPISGVFKTGETEAFALTLSRLYRLDRTRRGNDWVLTRRKG